MSSRRDFLKHSIQGTAGLAAGGALARTAGATAPTVRDAPTDAQLKEILERPVLRRNLFPDPVIIESVELLKIDGEYVVRVRSTDGAEGHAVSNAAKMRTLWPIFLERIAPFFEGKDARDLDRLVDDVMLFESNYKLMGLPVWVPSASVEFAVLDLLGRLSDRSVGELLGGVIRPVIEVYRANNFRGRSAEESVRRIVERYERERPPAIKFKVGGRMDIPEKPVRRSERLIPMVREALGDDVVLYADANGSYDVAEAVRIGRMLQDVDAAFFEEPCPYDWIWETKEVGDRLEIPIAGGEQEQSMRRFRWMVANNGLQIYQPDLLYFGGLIRSTKVARMAEAAGRTCTPHMSGSGLGMLYVLHWASVVPNAGPYQEYKGVNRNIPFESTSTLEAVEGKIPVPTGPGLGVDLDPDWVAGGRVLTDY